MMSADLRRLHKSTCSKSKASITSRMKCGSACALLAVEQTSRIERTPMRTEDLFSGAVPMVVKLDIGMTEPEGVALEITYAQTRERFEARQFDRAMYVMTIPMANEFLRLLETEMTGKGAQKH